MEKAFIGGLSRDTRYQRLLGARNLTQEEIRRLTHIDYGREMAFIAQDTNGGGGRQLGDARYVKDGVRGSAEFALVVADAWQHQGVGSLLLQALLQHAQAAGIERLHGITSANNQTMLNLARKFGFAQRPCPGDATLRQVEKTLPLRGLATLDDASAAHTGAAANDERIASPI